MTDGGEAKMAYSWLPISGATAIAIQTMQNHALRLGFVDYPGGRKQNPKPDPLLA